MEFNTNFKMTIQKKEVDQSQHSQEKRELTIQSLLASNF
jgi:hypothetical protein